MRLTPWRRRWWRRDASWTAFWKKKTFRRMNDSCRNWSKELFIYLLILWATSEWNNDVNWICLLRSMKWRCKDDFFQFFFIFHQSVGSPLSTIVRIQLLFTKQLMKILRTFFRLRVIQWQKANLSSIVRNLWVKQRCGLNLFIAINGMKM